MKDFMVVALVDGEPFAKFADTYDEAKDIMMNVECGFGGYAELYAREYAGSGAEYRLLEA